MRKTKLFAAIAALIALASCNSGEEEITTTGTLVPTEFTATIEALTKTSVDLTGKISWESTDEIVIRDGSYNTALYKIKKISSDGTATFVLKEGENGLGVGPYCAYYGIDPNSRQTYSEKSVNLYMVAPDTISNALTFSVMSGLIKINLTKGGESIKSISVTGTFPGGWEHTYTLFCEKPETLDKAKDFYISVPAGIYTYVDIINSSEIVCSLDIKNGNVFDNNILALSFGESDINFNADYAVPDLVDLGLSVKWASFNLGATKPEEYGCYYHWAGILDVSNPRLNFDYRDCPYHIGDDFFTGWTKYVPSEDLSYWSGNGEPDNKMVLDADDDVAHIRLGDKWRIPTGEEYKELRSNCTSEWTAVNGVYGTKFTSNINGNSIFLPAAGVRDVGGYGLVGSYGYYWSSSVKDAEHAQALFTCSDFVLMSGGDRLAGRTVRPVSE